MTRLRHVARHPLPSPHTSATITAFLTTCRKIVNWHLYFFNLNLCLPLPSHFILLICPLPRHSDGASHHLPQEGQFAPSSFQPYAVSFAALKLHPSYPPPTPHHSDDPLTTCRKIVNWRLFLKFPDEVAISPAASDLIQRLMCDVDDRLGTNGVHEIMVRRNSG